MSKKLLSLLGGLVLLSSSFSSQSFAMECDLPESQVVSVESKEKSEEELSKLINETIELAYKVDGVFQKVTVAKNGDVYLSAWTGLWKRNGAGEALVGKNFTINREAFRQWMIKDRSIELGSIRGSWVLILSKKTKKFVENILKLRQNGVYDRFINAYVDFIFDDELKIAEGKIAEVRKLLRRGVSFFF